jgi:hypothetical protein
MFFILKTNLSESCLLVEQVVTAFILDILLCLLSFALLRVEFLWGIAAACKNQSLMITNDRFPMNISGDKKNSFWRLFSSFVD